MQKWEVDGSVLEFHSWLLTFRDTDTHHVFKYAVVVEHSLSRRDPGVTLERAARPDHQIEHDE